MFSVTFSVRGCCFGGKNETWFHFCSRIFLHTTHFAAEFAMSDAADPRRVRLSKTLTSYACMYPVSGLCASHVVCLFSCRILRHNAVSLGLAMTPDGYVACDDLLRCSKVQGLTYAVLEDIAATCPKQRFQISVDAAGRKLIRATQGHTIAALDDESLLRKLSSPTEIPMAVHGTYMKAWHAIKVRIDARSLAAPRSHNRGCGACSQATGLNKMARNHIHFATGEPGTGTVMSGARNNVDVLVYLDVAAAMAAGIEFYISHNGVVLSRGIDGVIPPKYFTRAVQLKKGVPVAELPFERRDIDASAAAAAAVAATGGAPTSGGKRSFAAVAGGGRGRGTADPAAAGSAAKAGAKPTAAAAASAASTTSGPCPYRYLLVLDFEATCDSPVQTSPQEIIEFPTVVIDTSTGRIVDEFRAHVTPVVHPVISPFCTELTGIDQVRTSAVGGLR